MESIARAGMHVALLASAALAGACHQREVPAGGSGPQILDATQDPGAHVVATNEYSFAWIGSDPQARRDWFGSIINKGRNQCDLVTTTTLKAGDDGIDLWRVGCSNGAWLVTLGPGASRSVESCSGARTIYCRDGLKPIEWAAPST